VFVHGNPETPAIWGPLLGELHHPDVVTLSPPGFGAPVPEGFGSTADEYVAWLASELEKQAGPVDLVGHDWGGGHVMRIAMERPELIRSWAMDIAGCFSPDYVWHDLAQVWQTPGGGEEAVAGMASLPVADRASLFESLGMTPDIAVAQRRRLTKPWAAASSPSTAPLPNRRWLTSARDSAPLQSGPVS
jgi:pimeloyl-ACP methyl ester carboxylesterase